MSLKDKLEGNPERSFQTNTVTQENSDNLNPAEPAEDLSEKDQTQSEE